MELEVEPRAPHVGIDLNSWRDRAACTIQSSVLLRAVRVRELAAATNSIHINVCNPFCDYRTSEFFTAVQI